MVKINPPVKQMEIDEREFCSIHNLKNLKCSKDAFLSCVKNLDHKFKPIVDLSLIDYEFQMGKPETISTDEEIEIQGYRLQVTNEGICLKAKDEAGFVYGLDTLRQVLAQAVEGKVKGLKIRDYPILKKRGVMLDISRGKVYSMDYLLNLMDTIKALRFNVFQLYTEHTFEFTSHPEISKGSGGLTGKDILRLQAKCEENGIELQANLQSLGHMHRILTRPAYQELAESNMYWSLDTTNEKSYELLDDLYGEYLPLFKSEWINVCSDEPYDLGQGKSSSKGKDIGHLYLDHLLRLHKLAKKYGKRIMVFGDVVKVHPELVGEMPDDIIYLDWIYDPKEQYGTPKLFQEAKIPFWVSPGTGNWNTLFPRLRGAIMNISTLTLEGIASGAEGMLLTDWNDHGGYTQPGPTYYTYGYAAHGSWSGETPKKEEVASWMDEVLELPGYGELILKLGEIFEIPTLWSKNRSQDVMALFDEPIFGQATRGPVPPENLEAYNLTLPPGVEPVFERHSQHPLRPYFCMGKSVRDQIEKIIHQAKPSLEKIPSGPIKNQLIYIIQGYQLMVDKLRFSEKIIGQMNGRHLEDFDFVRLEEEVRILIKRYTHLQLDFIKNWCDVAKISEIEISLTYFAWIISRLDYLRDWLSIQRENIETIGVDWTFETYETTGYGTLPTY